MNRTPQSLYDFSSLSCEFSMVVIGASAGGIKALTRIVEQLPGNLPVPIAIVQHCAPVAPALLAAIIGRRAELFVKYAEQGEHLLAGHAYIAPAGLHLLIGAKNTVALSDAPKVRYSRPSIDLLFKSAASQFPSKTLGVVLTGANDDGAEGVRCIRNFGGMVIAQSCESAEQTAMPLAAIRTGCVDHVLPLDSIASAVIALTMSHGAAQWMRTFRLN